MSSIYKGSCLCGGVTYQVSHVISRVGHCHCNMCRKFHGAAFSTFGEALSKHFKWLSGDTLLGDFVATNGTVRRFCKQCGSSLTFQRASDEQMIEFALGTLDTPITLEPDAHIYIESKADWFSIHDDLPQYKQSRTNK